MWTLWTRNCSDVKRVSASFIAYSWESSVLMRYGRMCSALTTAGEAVVVAAWGRLYLTHRAGRVLPAFVGSTVVEAGTTFLRQTTLLTLLHILRVMYPGINTLHLVIISKSIVHLRAHNYNGFIKYTRTLTCTQTVIIFLQSHV